MSARSLHAGGMVDLALALYIWLAFHYLVQKGAGLEPIGVHKAFVLAPYYAVVLSIGAVLYALIWITAKPPLRSP